jgi:hypothetical protein
VRSLIIGVVSLLVLVDVMPAQVTPGASCSYRSCALRIHGNRILAGAEARQVASLGRFQPPRLRPLAEVSDSVSFYLDLVERNYTSGRVLSLVGAFVFATSFFFLQEQDFDGAEPIALGLGVGGVVVQFIGSRRIRTANHALADAIWWYNAELPNP